MKKSETKQLLNKIKAYYPNFYLEDYIVDAWVETLEPYEYDDSLEYFKEYLKNNPNKAPQPHVFIKGMLTPEEKEKAEKDYIVDCNLCGRTMLYSNYDTHYKKCLLCKALEKEAKERNKDLKYEDFMRIPYEKLDKGYGKLFEKGSEKTWMNYTLI